MNGKRESLIVSEVPGMMRVVSLTQLRDQYRWARNETSLRAKWVAQDPSGEPNTCRYCGRHWRQWAGSKLDGHAKCIVTSEFKAWLRDLMRDPTVTYKLIADAIDVTPAVVRSWTYPIRGIGRAP